MLEVKKSQLSQECALRLRGCRAGSARVPLPISFTPLLLPALTLTLTPARGGAGWDGLPSCLHPARMPVALGPKSQSICVELCIRGISLPSSISGECSDGERWVPGCGDSSGETLLASHPSIHHRSIHPLVLLATIRGLSLFPSPWMPKSL